MPQDAGEDVLFSVVYQFLIGNPNSPPQAPLLSNGNQYSYSSASSVRRVITADLDDLSMLNTFNEAVLSTPPPHSPSMQVGVYNTYTHTQHTWSHGQRCRLRPSPYDIPPAPGLIRDSDKGYTDSLPTSPLDLTFGNVHAQSVGMSAADNICGASFGHVATAAANGFSAPAHGLVVTGLFFFLPYMVALLFFLHADTSVSQIFLFGLPEGSVLYTFTLAPDASLCSFSFTSGLTRFARVS
ncbi:hypothetical protein BC835DRAFT_1422277 [Cytidiella melzeri]|nr:hypothetical protein BC835DRAFT_1422277 [Cytidiella melzeri]